MQKTMKIVLSSLAVLAFAGLLLFFGGDMCADDSYADDNGTCGAAGYENAVTWTYTSSNQTITIGGNGPMADYERNTSPWYSHRNEINKVVIGADVTHIGNYAFYSYQVSPNANNGVFFEEGSRLQSIGDYAFQAYNDSFMLIYLNKTKTFTIPEGVTSIGKYAFYGEMITNLVLPNSLVTIGENAFNMYRYGEYNITIGTGLTTVGANAFTYIKSLTFLGNIPADIQANSFVSQKAFRFSTANQPEPAQVAAFSSMAYWYKYNEVTGAATIVGGSTEGNPFNLAFNNQYPWGQDVSEINYNGVDKIDNQDIRDAALMKTGTTSTGGYVLVDKLTINGENMIEAMGDKGLLFYKDANNTPALYKIPAGVKTLTGDDFPATMVNFKLIFGSETLESLTIPARANQVYLGKFTALTYLKIDAQVDYMLSTPEGASSGSSINNCSKLKTVDLSGSSLIAINQTGTGKNFPASVENVILPDTMKKVSFQGCANLTSIDLKNVETINQWGLAEMTSIVSLDLKNVKTLGDYAVKKCTSLKTVNAPNVETIGQSAFEQDYALESVVIGDKCTSIGQWAFRETAIKSFTVPKNVTIGYHEYALYMMPLEEIKLADGYAGENTLANGVLMIDGGKKVVAAALCSDSIVIPDTVETIGAQVFDGGKLTSVTLGSNVTTIEDNAFAGCTNLTSIDLKNVTTLGRMVFQNCTSLTSFDFKNVTTSGDSIIFRCSGLESVNFGKLTAIPNGACSDLKNLRTVIAENATSVGRSAFSGCTSLETLVLSEDCTSLGDYFLQNCGLKVFTLPKSITLTASQGPRIFYQCMVEEFRLADGYEGTNIVMNGFILTEDGKTIVAVPLGASLLNVPDSVETIAQQQFANSKAAGIVFGSGVSTIGRGPFQNSDVLSVYFKSTDKLTSMHAQFLTAAKNSSSIRVYYSGSVNPSTLCPALEGKTLASSMSSLSISFNTNGGDTITNMNTYRNVSGVMHVGLTEDSSLPEAVKAGCLFVGWYTDSELTNPFNMKVLPAGFFGRMTLYAKWVQASDLVDGISVVAFSGPSVVLRIDSAEVPAGNMIVTYSEFVDLAEGSVLFPFAIGTVAVTAGSDTVVFTNSDEKAIATCSVSFRYDFGTVSFCTPLTYASAPDTKAKVDMEIDPGCKLLFNGSIINDGDTVEVGEYTVSTTGADSILVNGMRYYNSNGTKLFYCGQKLVVKA